jgi:hypothetical protein
MKEVFEITKVAVVGTVGGFTTFKLADYATLVSILVGLATLTYIVAKTYFLIKSGGRAARD